MSIQKVSIHNRNIEARIKALDNWKISNEDKEDLLEFLKDLSLGKVNRGRQITEARQLKYLDTLKPVFVYLKKPISKITLKDMENLDLDLSKNIIKRQDGKPYAEDTKKHLKKMFKIYLKWKFKDKIAYFVELTSWMDTRTAWIKTPEFLSEEEIIKLYKACKNARERFLITILFDSGARAEEFLNIRFEDIISPKDNNFYKIALKEEYSKTLGRTIGLYWKYSTEAVKEFLEERIKQGIKPQEPIYNGTYAAARAFLRRLGKKALNKRVHFHLFRHSSATFLASKLNRQELCYRYGWKFSSNMPDTYISRSGMMERQVEEKFNKTELEEVYRKLQQQEQHGKILNEKVETNEKQNRIIAEKIKLLLEVFRNSPEETKSIIRKHKEQLIKIFS